MVESLDLRCPRCSGLTPKTLDWLHHHSECACDHCGLVITIAMNRQWSDYKREWNAQHHDGSPPRRRLP
jgi:transcription initiation factor TFIIIB Brf1 subunit/transcription initiation factor TFIIB